jgi:hypothetical protein
MPMNAHVFSPRAECEGTGSIDPARLREANINPTSGLATDYLNHFNEAIMMLELVPTMPACIDDLMAWKVMSYREHFLSSHQKHRDLVLAAYDAADPEARRMLDDITAGMDSILTATRDALRLQLSQPVAAALAQEAAEQLKPLVARAGAVINGLVLGTEGASAGAPQAAVDALMER